MDRQEELVQIRETEMLLRASSQRYEEQTQAGWEELHSIISPDRRKHKIVWNLVAASITALLFFSAGIIKSRHEALPDYITHDVKIMTGPGQRSSTSLPDGTIVNLNHCSTLSYNISGWKEHRTAHLDGQGFFEVVHMEGVAFEITTDLFTVTDIGTSFDISCYKDDSVNSVSIETGSASISIKGMEDSYILNIGETLLYEPKTGNVSIMHVAKQSSMQWVNGEIIFDNNTLIEKKNELERMYGYSFKLDKSCSSLHYMAMFCDESLDEMMAILQEMTPGLKYTIDEINKTISIWK